MELYLQALFTLLDVLSRWLRDAAQAEAQALKKTSGAGGSTCMSWLTPTCSMAADAVLVCLPAASSGSEVQAKELKRSMERVTAFLEAIPKQQLAQVGTRPLLHLLLRL
jgi:hypothetical protein